MFLLIILQIQYRVGHRGIGYTFTDEILSNHKRSNAFGRPNCSGGNYGFPFHTVSVRVTEETEVHNGVYAHNSPGICPLPCPKVITFRDGTNETEDENSSDKLMAV